MVQRYIFFRNKENKYLCFFYYYLLIMCIKSEQRPLAHTIYFRS